MNRRIALQTLPVLALLPHAHAQPARETRVATIGFLSSVGIDPNPPTLVALKDELQRLGWIEGRNLVLEVRRALGDTSKFEGLARELAAIDLDLVITTSDLEAVVAARAMPHRPIVFCGGFGPVEQGLAKSLARPGGQITGFTYEQDISISGRRLQFAKDYVPELRRVGLLVEGLPMEEPTIDLLRQVGSKIGVTFSVQRVRQAAEFDSAFAAFAREGVQVIGPFFSPLLVAEAARIVALSRRYGWPDIGSNVAEVELGGFLAYSVNVPDLYRRAAGYADRILRGEKPGELPIQQPIQYDLVINLRAAKALGRPVPQSLLLQATRLIE